MSKKPTPVTVAVPFKFRKLLDADGGLPHEAIKTERAEAMRALVGESLAYMGHSDIKTTLRYAHHVPEHDAAQRFTQAIAQQRGVSQDVSRRAEKAAQLSATTRTEYVPAESSFMPTG